jgi:hypothetical protein
MQRMGEAEFLALQHIPDPVPRLQVAAVAVGEGNHRRSVHAFPAAGRPVVIAARVAAPVEVTVVLAQLCQLRHVAGMAEGVRLPEHLRFDAQVLARPLLGVQHVPGDGLAVRHVQVAFHPGAGNAFPAAFRYALLNLREDIRVHLPHHIVERHLADGEG